MSLARVWQASLLCAVVTACAGGPAFDGRVYRSEEMTFRVGPTPSGWRELDAEGALLAFRDEGQSATIAVSGRCGVDGDDVPLSALTHHLFLQFTDRQIVSQELVPLDGREALRSELHAKLDGVPMHYLVYVLKKDGCVYDFVRIGADGATTGEFDRFVQGFSTVS